MSNDTKLSTIEIRGKKCDIFVTAKGIFYCDLDSDEDRREGLGGANVFEARSIADLTKKIEATLKKKTIAIRFVRWQKKEDNWRRRCLSRCGIGIKESYLREGTVKGLHQGNGNLLYFWNDDPRKETHQGYKYRQGTKEFMRMTEAQKKEYTRLQKLVEDTEQKIKLLEEKCGIEVIDEIEKITNK